MFYLRLLTWGIRESLDERKGWATFLFVFATVVEEAT